MGLLDKFKKSRAEKKAVKVDSAKKAKEEKPKTTSLKDSKDRKQSMKDLYGKEDVKKVKPTLAPPDTSSFAKATEDKKAMAGKKALVGKKDKKTEKKTEKKHGNAYRVLVKPIVTEKASMLGAENKYVFAVSPRANKIEITKAINEVYGIKPIAINIVKMQGKRVRYGRISGKTKDWKKAIITLPEGQTIKVYEGV